MRTRKDAGALYITYTHSHRPLVCCVAACFGQRSDFCLSVATMIVLGLLLFCFITTLNVQKLKEVQLSELILMETIK